MSAALHIKSRARFAAHNSAVKVLSISNDCSYLISGDLGGKVVIWDISRKAELQAFRLDGEPSIESATWLSEITVQGELATGFLLGIGLGDIHVFKRLPGSNRFSPVSMRSTSELLEPVRRLAFDPFYRRVASSTDGCVKMWRLTEGEGISVGVDLTKAYMSADGELDLANTLDADSTDDIIASLYFAEAGNLLVASFREGEVGFAALCPNKTFVVTNLVNGLEIYNFPPSHLLQRIHHPIKRNIPLRVASIFDGEMLLVGSDDGEPRIANRAIAGGLECTLPHAKASPIPLVEASVVGSLAYVATGATEAPFDVKLWTMRKRDELSASSLPVIIVLVLCFLGHNLLYRPILQGWQADSSPKWSPLALSGELLAVVESPLNELSSLDSSSRCRIDGCTGTGGRTDSGTNHCRDEDYEVLDPQETSDIAVTKRNIDWVLFGEWKIRVWYFSPHPTRLKARTLAICSRCFKYFSDLEVWEVHQEGCQQFPPGKKVYSKNDVTIWEIDPEQDKLYCQNLSLFGKLFIDAKSLFYYLDGFMFYVVARDTHD
ncbi:hypothetical protein D9611_008884 [Ephemerocybe angulata]|uniref:MYST-type HAT domain-containing protein n=1 Tax=Ephemerocybe angulata TaxID=980116 RepID=A0A8H5BYQ6_9AGAR|nr:hypothetical protein D9611_008884 [Tulosesus angulatus]